MQLKKIKLSGFKSFVDPTSISMPSNLVSVVGPNGCGKSNIIDAVCWVMGESSAKQLRGQSLTDVIFNGSSARKPVGQASVELVFDNQDGGIGGEYASYAEISIRRQINRESDSVYFLNGTRCRRRDIIDIFLGTGLGPRSYSIIGQNMISRVIEAKPDDMRVHIEEAAGVSKYKERRRETENRIRHTKDNLTRLDDVKAELDKQLATLKRQANAAEKFQVLKKEERETKSEWLAIQWREYDTKLVEDSLKIQQESTKLESILAEISNLNLEHDQKREFELEASEEHQSVQGKFYTIGNDIARLEQDIHHHKEREKVRQNEINQVSQDLESTSNQIEEFSSEAENLLHEINKLEPESKEAIDLARSYELKFENAEDAMQEWQTDWDEFNQKISKNTQLAQVEQTRIRHLEQKISSITKQQEKYQAEAASLDFEKLENDLEDISDKFTVYEEEVEHNEEVYNNLNQQINEINTTEHQVVDQLNNLRNKLQVANDKGSSLKALQETAVGRSDSELKSWLSDNNLNNLPRLAESIEVASGWEVAVEKVLGAYLKAVCVDDFSDLSSKINELSSGSLFAVTKANNESAECSSDSLLSKVTSEWPLESLLGCVHTADSKEEAFEKAKFLKSNESIITRDGIWLGATWLQVIKDENPENGVFQRENELKALEIEIEELNCQIQDLEDKAEECSLQKSEKENQKSRVQSSLKEANNKYADLKAKKNIASDKLLNAKSRSVKVAEETELLNEAVNEANEELSDAREIWQKAMQDLEQESTKREILVNKKNVLREELHKTRFEVNERKDLAHKLEISLETSRSQKLSVDKSIERLTLELNKLNHRKSSLLESFEENDSIDDLEYELETKLKLRLDVESDLNDKLKKKEEITQKIKDIELRKQEFEDSTATVRSKLEKLRIDSQGLKVKSETLLEQLKEVGANLEETIQSLPEDAVAELWQQKLEQITSRISRLGAINLVAIEEYSTCLERKEYIDQQYNDLIEGLNTLENAIQKIDKETRNLFKETFDKVNSRFQELFPKVFGGGRAYLDLTGDNLLDSGITVMACPPGKRNSTIHLLSGGEKALTAIALVFSIFHLNPAPFCLLDEVDAPLDDANVGRFCNLVKAMAEKTQFIFISHNKLAIEMAENLIGVTMHEPGVSRLVSVDVNEAVSLAEA